MFKHKRIIKLGETDAAGRLYFLVPLNWCQETFEEYLLNKDYKLSEMLKGGYQTPVVHVECDLKYTAFVSDEIEIHITSVNFKNRSFDMNYNIFVGEKILATAKMTHVCVDTKSGKAIQIPSQIKEVLVP